MRWDQSDLLKKPGDWLLYSRSVCYRFASATARSYHLGRCRAEQERKWNDTYLQLSANFLLSQTASTARYIREHSADIRSYSFAAPKYNEPRKVLEWLIQKADQTREWYNRSRTFTHPSAHISQTCPIITVQHLQLDALRIYAYLGIYSQPTPANSTEETEKEKTNIEYKWIYYYA